MRHSEPCMANTYETMHDDTWLVRLWRWRHTPKCCQRRRYIRIVNSRVEYFLRAPQQGDVPMGRIEYAQAREQGPLCIELLNGGSHVACLRAESSGTRAQILRTLTSLSRGALLLAEVDALAASAARRASVLVVGPSARHGNTLSVLLGAAARREPQSDEISYRYGDFGGTLLPTEHAQPHLGAFRMLAETLLGLAGQEAAEAARTMWGAAQHEVNALERPGGLEWPGGQFIFVASAENLVVGLPAGPQSSEACAIDALAGHFTPNDSVHSIAMIPMAELVRCSQEGVPYASALTESARGRQKNGKLWLRADMVGSIASAPRGEGSG